jgi:hypothetical protein
MKIDCGLL